MGLSGRAATVVKSSLIWTLYRLRFFQRIGNDMAALCVRLARSPWIAYPSTVPPCSPGEIRATVGRSNDGPEAVHDAQKDEQNKHVACPLGAPVNGVSLGGDLRRAVCVEVGSEGTVVWGRADEQGRGLGVDGVVV
jgi:hypothetical protein